MKYFNNNLENVSERRFKFLNARVEIVGIESTLNTLEKWFFPFYQVDKSNENNKQVTLEIDENPFNYQKLHDEFKSISVKKMHLHTKKEGFAGKIDDYLLVYDPEVDIIVVTSKKEMRVRVFGVDFNSNQYRLLELIRLVRGLFNVCGQENGSIRGHAAAMTMSQRTFLIVGDKGAGKTSFLTSALQSKEQKIGFITNDKCFIAPDCSVWGLPYAIAISPECLPNCLELKSKQSISTVNRKLLFWPDVFTNSFNKELSAGGKIDMVLLPDLNLSMSSVNFTKASLSEINSYISILNTDDDVVHPRWLPTSLGLKESEKFSITKELTQIPWIKMKGNPWNSNWTHKLEQFLIEEGLLDLQLNR
jgi:hypothetical protein